jgi:serine/threonine-protein kinase
VRSDAASVDIVDISRAEPPLRTLGRYSLYGAIGSGGMATVHLGRLAGAAGFSRVVAIKRMHPHLARDPAFVTMFTDEARVAARIRHPNVVQTLDVASVEGELFVVLEYVHGVSLSQMIRLLRSARETVPLGVALRIGCDVLQGLHGAHEAHNARGERLELVHRDVSPQNVLVGVDGVARVLDFGVAKALGRMQASAEGEIKGKVAYVAPEQLRGEIAGRTTDIYSAAVLIWEVLAGKQLFSGSTEATVLMAVLEGRIPSLRGLRRDVSPALEAVLLRGLSALPARRYQTAGEMADALERASPPANAREVAAWITHIAGRALEKRSALVAHVEAIESGAPLEGPLDIEHTPTGAVGTSNRRSRTALSSEIGANQTMTSRRAAIWAISAGLGGALAVGAALIARGPSSDAVAPEVSADARANAAAPSAPSVEPPSVAPVQVAEPRASATASPAATASAAAPPTATAASTARPKPKTPPANKPSAPAPSSERLEDLFGRN